MQLRELRAVNAPFLSQLLDYLLNKCEEISEKRKCPNEWDEFVMALASSSPICALIHPRDELQQVLTTIADGTADLDVYTLQFLQQNCPLMLNVLQKVKTPPKQLSSVLYELMEKANAPFKTCTVNHQVAPVMTTIHIFQLCQRFVVAGLMWQIL